MNSRTSTARSSRPSICCCSSPGELTAEFFRDVASDISRRFACTWCAACFFSPSLPGVRRRSSPFSMTKDDIQTPHEREAVQRETRRQARASARRDDAQHAARHVRADAGVWSVLVGVYRRAQPYYVPHLYYAIHFHAFVFLMLAITRGVFVRRTNRRGRRRIVSADDRSLSLHRLAPRVRRHALAGRVERDSDRPGLHADSLPRS